MALEHTCHFMLETYLPQKVSYFESNFNDLKEKIYVKGPYPLEKAALWAASQRFSVEVIHNCLDDSIQGVILPGQQMGIWVESLPEDLVPAETWKILEASRAWFQKARKIHDKQEEIYIENMDFTQADFLTEETLISLFGMQTSPGQGKVVDRFFGAPTVAGNINYIPEITEGLSHRYFIKGRPGTGKSTFLKKIAGEALARGFQVERYHCSLAPDSLDMVVVRDLHFCVFDSTAPHEYFPSRPGDEIIDMYTRCITPGTDEKYACQLERLDLEYRKLLKKGMEELRRFKDAYDEIGKQVPPGDIDHWIWEE